MVQSAIPLCFCTLPQRCFPAFDRQWLTSAEHSPARPVQQPPPYYHSPCLPGCSSGPTYLLLLFPVVSRLALQLEMASAVDQPSAAD